MLTNVKRFNCHKTGFKGYGASCKKQEYERKEYDASFCRKKGYTNKKEWEIKSKKRQLVNNR